MTSVARILDWLDHRDRVLILLAALFAGGLAWGLLGALRVPGLAALGGLCAAAVLIDGRRFLIPDPIGLAVAATGLVDTLATGAPLAERLAGMAAVLILLLALRLGMNRWTGQTALGLGDVKFLAAAAAWLPPMQVPTYVLLAALSGLAEALLRRPRPDRIAFGRHLAPWLVFCVLAGPGLSL